MELKNIIYEKQGSVAIIKLNRPKALNALNTELLQELEVVVSAVENDEEVRVAIVTGEGKAFAAGADIAAMKDMNSMEGLAYAKTGQAVYRHMPLLAKFKDPQPQCVIDRHGFTSLYND